MGVFDRIFGGGRDVSAARKAELRGDLARAQELWAEAARPDEAARVMLLRGDADSDVRTRLAYYTQAAAIAPADHEVRRLARKKRAELVLAIAEEGALTAVLRHDLLQAARDLEELGELATAARAFAVAGDADAQANALVEAGEVERLEQVLDATHAKARHARRRRDVNGEIDGLVASGRRREALALAESFALEEPGEPTSRERAVQLRARRVLGPSVAIEVRGARVELLLGDEVILGRTEGSVLVPSHAVSRRHLRIARIARAGEAGAVVEDLASRNGTELRGMRIAGTLPVGDGLDLKLGGEVPVRIAPASNVLVTDPDGAELAGAIAIEIGGVRRVAPLGPARIGAFLLEAGADGWLELASDAEHPAYLGEMMLVPRATLMAGDAISDRRGGAPVLRILGRS